MLDVAKLVEHFGVKVPGKAVKPIVIYAGKNLQPLTAEQIKGACYYGGGDKPAVVKIYILGVTVVKAKTHRSYGSVTIDPESIQITYCHADTTYKLATNVQDMKYTETCHVSDIRNLNLFTSVTEPKKLLGLKLAQLAQVVKNSHVEKQKIQKQDYARKMDDLKKANKVS